MRTRVLMAFVAAGAIGLAACGGDNSSTSSTAAPAAASATTAAAAAATATTVSAAAAGAGGYAAPGTTAPAASAAATTLTLIDSSHGKILADAQGPHAVHLHQGRQRHVGLFGRVRQGVAAGHGHRHAHGGERDHGRALATITRADGTTQLAINGQPLYTYAGDAAPGDTQGQGSNQVWWVVGADGTAIKS